MAGEMNSYRIEIELHAESTGEAHDISAFVDAMTDELMDLEDADDRLHDVDVSAVLSRGTIVVELIVDEASAPEALQLADATVRCAGHAAGANTPGWTVGRWAVSDRANKEMAAA